MKARALDLFCGAGGMSMGLHRAGWDVVGVDIVPQPRYPFEFVQADALAFPVDGFQLVCASPPCQAYSCFQRLRKRAACHPDLVAATRSCVQSAPLWCIENVAGSPLYPTVMLCGLSFGLKLLRHRFFETNFWVWSPPHRAHRGRVADGDYVTVAGHGGPGRGPNPINKNTLENSRKAAWAAAMGIDWMLRRELAQAIPPAYGEWIGRAAMESLVNALPADLPAGAAATVHQ